MSVKVIFQGHCDVCHSSDAGTHYADGGYHCFSCGHHKGTSRELPWKKEVIEQEEEKIITLPDDLSTEYSQECVKWLAEYYISVPEVIKRGGKWSKSRNQLIFSYQRYDDPKLIGLVQARNFGDNVKRKYINEGDVNLVLPVYLSTSYKNKLVITEDIISAIKVARFENSMPLLGSHLNITKMLWIKHQGYRSVVVWLDHDKYEQALNISMQFSLIGMRTSVICTDLDPKCYDNFVLEYKLDEQT